MNTSIKHDSQGFLIGELIETSKVALASQQAGVGIWRGIRADVSAIAKAMGLASRASSSQQGEARTSRKISEPAGRAASSAVGLRPYGAQVQVATPRGRDAAGRFLPAPAVSGGAIKDIADKAESARAVAEFRDGKGRFGGGGKKDPKSAKKEKKEKKEKEDADTGKSAFVDKLGRVASNLKDIAESTANVDPAIAAAGEIKAVVQPIGRLAFTLFGRSDKQKKERWYSKILNALTGKKESTTVVAGGGDEGGAMLSGFFGGGLMRAMLPIVAAIGTAIIAMAPVVGAALAAAVAAVVVGWLAKKAVDALKPIVEEGYKDFSNGRDAVSKNRVAPTGQTLDSSGRDLNDPRRIDRKEATGTDGRAINDPRRVDLVKSDAPLPPAKNFAESLGRGVEHSKEFLVEKAGFKSLDSSNDPLSKEYQDRQKNQRTGKGVSGLAGARWNNGAREDLTGAAVVAGVDPGLVAQIGRFESEFDSKATPTRRDGSRISSAHGYGQFIDGTWTDIVNRHGSKYGVEGAGKLTTDQAGALRNDPKLQAAMLAEFTKENVAKGRANGGKDDAANVYAYHNLGDGDAKRMLSAVKSNPAMSARDALIGGRDIGEKERARIESVISNNKSLYGNGSIPASAAYARMGQKMRDGDSYAADARLLASNGGVARSASGIRVPGTVSVAGLQTVVPANIPSSVPQKLPSSPEVTMPPPSPSEKQRPIVVSSNTPVGQNVSDRTIAHTASGGIGSDGRW